MHQIYDDHLQSHFYCLTVRKGKKGWLHFIVAHSLPKLGTHEIMMSVDVHNETLYKKAVNSFSFVLSCLQIL